MNTIQEKVTKNKALLSLAVFGLSAVAMVMSLPTQVFAEPPTPEEQLVTAVEGAIDTVISTAMSVLPAVFVVFAIFLSLRIAISLVRRFART